MTGGIGGIFLVVVFGAVAVCGAALIPRLYRAGSADPGESGAAPPDRGLARLIRRLWP